MHSWGVTFFQVRCLSFSVHRTSTHPMCEINVLHHYSVKT